MLALLSNEDQQAFEILYDRYWEDLYLLAYLMLRNKDASKDIVQEVFIWLWEHRLSLQIKSLRAYLKTAVKYKVANHIRSGNIRESVFQKLSAVSTSLDNASALAVNDHALPIAHIGYHVDLETNFRVLAKDVQLFPFACLSVNKITVVRIGYRGNIGFFPVTAGEPADYLAMQDVCYSRFFQFT